jgi:hypothetical protein
MPSTIAFLSASERRASSSNSDTPHGEFLGANDPRCAPLNSRLPHIIGPKLRGSQRHTGRTRATVAEDPNHLALIDLPRAVAEEPKCSSAHGATCR